MNADAVKASVITSLANPIREAHVVSTFSSPLILGKLCLPFRRDCDVSHR